jgi:hypothetical protein
MLAVYSNYGEFDKQIQKLQQKQFRQKADLSSILIFHAHTTGPASFLGKELKNNGCDDIYDDLILHLEKFHDESNDRAASSLYGIAIPEKSKISVTEDWRDEGELKEEFPSIPSSLVSKVWKQQRQSWQSTFQILSSLLLSKNSNLLVLENCDFVFEDHSWPSILETVNCRSHSHSSGVTGWTLVEMDSFLSNPLSIPSSPNNLIHTAPATPPPFSPESALQDWSMIKMNLPPSSFSAKTSYRDILLVAARQVPLTRSEENLDGIYAANQEKKWKPLIIVNKVPAIRRDRLYLNSKPLLSLESTPTIPLTDDEKEYLRLMQEEGDGKSLCLCLFIYFLIISYLFFHFLIFSFSFL